MTGKTAFVTGASGFIGVNLVKQLGEAGWSVTAMHRHTVVWGWFTSTRCVYRCGNRPMASGSNRVALSLII